MTEAKIIQGCKQHKAHCQKALVTKYAPLLLTVCRRYVPQDSMAEDALQEAFIRIFRYIDKYQATGSFEAWMRKIAVTSAIQFVQRSGILVRKEINGVMPEHMASPVPDAYNQLRAEELLALIQSLPTGYRMVFNLYALDGYSHREIGEILDISESSSRSQLVRARAYLLKELSTLDKENTVNTYTT